MQDNPSTTTTPAQTILTGPDPHEHDDFQFFAEFVEAIAPDCRRYVKRMRDDTVHDNQASLAPAPPKPCDVPLYRVFDALFALVDTLGEDPATLARMRARLPMLKEIADGQNRRRKAQRKAAKAEATLARLEMERTQRLAKL